MYKFYTWYYIDNYGPYYIMWFDMKKNNGYYVFTYRNKLNDFSHGNQGPFLTWEFDQLSDNKYIVKDPPLSIEDRHKMIRQIYEI